MVCSPSRTKGSTTPFVRNRRLSGPTGARKMTQAATLETGSSPERYSKPWTYRANVRLTRRLGSRLKYGSGFFSDLSSNGVSQQPEQ